MRREKEGVMVAPMAGGHGSVSGQGGVFHDAGRIGPTWPCRDRSRNGEARPRPCRAARFVHLREAVLSGPG